MRSCKEAPPFPPHPAGMRVARYRDGPHRRASLQKLLRLGLKGVQEEHRLFVSGVRRLGRLSIQAPRYVGRIEQPVASPQKRQEVARTTC
jgi:hypothetical protein